MRLLPRGRHPLLLVIGLLLLAYAIWGLYASYPTFDVLRSESANVRIALPDSTVTP